MISADELRTLQAKYKEVNKHLEDISEACKKKAMAGESDCEFEVDTSIGFKDVLQSIMAKLEKNGLRVSLVTSSTSPEGAKYSLHISW